MKMAKDKEKKDFLEDEEVSIAQKKELDRYSKYVKSIQKYNPMDEDEYLYLTKEMNNIISNNKDNFSDIELLELTQKLDKIELTKDYTTELLELTKEIKKIIKPEVKYNIPKISKKENLKKEKIKPLSRTAVLPKINNTIKKIEKKEVVTLPSKEEPTKSNVNQKNVNNKNNQTNKKVVTFKDLVDKNNSNNKVDHFNTVEMHKLRAVVNRKEIEKSKKVISKKEKVLWSISFGMSVLVFAFLCVRFICWEVENRMSHDQISDIYEVADLNEVVALGTVSDVVSKEVAPITPPTPPSTERPNDYWYYMSMSMLNVNFDELKAINPDTVGWIQVSGTNINYPYVQTNNNEYYLKHSFNNSYNSAGWVFQDYRNNSNDYGKNNILYAHGRLDNTMFGSLKVVVTPAWYNNSNNYVVKTSTPKINALWQVFSVYTIMPESYYIRTKFSDDEFTTFINTITARSVHNFNVNMSPDDKILTLSSCYDNQRRVVLHAKLIRIEEK